MYYNELSENQSRIQLDMEQLYESYKDAVDSRAKYKGSMRWKPSNGNDYLFHQINRGNYGKSLGLRTLETEKRLADFNEGKEKAISRLQSLNEQIKEQARMCKAVKIHRVPTAVTKILGKLEKEKLLGKNLTVIGTNVLFAYEAIAGVRFEQQVTATRDMDLLYDAKSKLKIAGDIEEKGVLGLLQQIDPTYKKMRNGFKAVNDAGFEVDLIKRIPKNPMANNENQSIGDKSDLQAVETYSQKWLLASKKVFQTIIGADGLPATMCVPDPRIYVLHKLWLSEDKEREPGKKRRDKLQAYAVADLILNHLPQYKFNSKDLRILPKEILHNAALKQDMPADFRSQVLQSLND